MPASFTWQPGPTGGTPLTDTNLNKLAVVADIGTAGTPTGDALKAAFGGVSSPTAQAFNLPLLTAGTGVNPTVVIGIDPVSGLMFGADRPTNDLSMSADGGVTWQTIRGMPTNVNHVQLHKVVRFGAYIYLFAISGLDGRAGVYRAPAPTAATSTITWDATRYALMSPSTSASGPNFESLNGKSTAFAAGSAAILLGDYGDFAAGPIIQRSTDGVTWATVWSSATSRHVHAVGEDPYNPGTWYATIGDGAANTNGVLRSTDNGATWTTIITGSGGNLFQAVQISFSQRHVYLGADHYGSCAFYFDRANPTIRNLTFGSHWFMPVPDGVAGRIITDLATTSGSTTVTSASFTAQDMGRTIQADNIPQFGAVSNIAEPNWLTTAGAGTATLRRAATATGTAQTAAIGGDRFFEGCYLGAVDPATDIYYFAAMDTSSVGNTYGIFAVPTPGAAPILLAAISGTVPTDWRPIYEVFVNNGQVYVGTRRFPAIAT